MLTQCFCRVKHVLFLNCATSWQSNNYWWITHSLTTATSWQSNNYWWITHSLTTQQKENLEETLKFSWGAEVKKGADFEVQSKDDNIFYKCEVLDFSTTNDVISFHWCGFDNCFDENTRFSEMVAREYVPQVGIMRPCCVLYQYEMLKKRRPSGWNYLKIFRIFVKRSVQDVFACVDKKRG